MINELLDEAQIEAKTLILKMEPCSPRTILDRVEASMTILTQKKGLVLTTFVRPDLPISLVSDERRLQQILINLIGNAIKFTRKGEIKVELFKSTPSHWCIQVSDTGVGIPNKEHAQIFEPFHKVNSSLTGDNRGTGLGLSITQQLVDLMEGQIQLQSEIGKGSIFTVTLPIIENSEGEPAIKPFALIVEDDPKLVHIFEAVLKEAGFETDMDMEGNRVFDKLEARVPILIVLDLHLPFVSGAEILNKIRSDPRWARIPVILTTADLSLAKSLQGQVEDVLIKPVRVTRLREIAIRLLDKNTKDKLFQQEHQI
jgi:CheY-like chemotaxis protein/anti-sigma regulatory factor (Ser/Thr protein kinase)